MLGWAGSRLAVEESGQAWRAWWATKDRAGLRKGSDVVLDAGGPGWIEALALALGRNLAVYVLGQRSALLLLLFFLFLFLLSESLR